MAFNAETALLNDKKEKSEDHVRVESKTELNTEELSKILNACATSYVLSSQIENGKINYVGKVTFYVCYQNDLGELKKCETGSEFTGSIPLKDENCKVVLKSNVIKTEVDTSKITLTVSAIVGVTAECYFKNEFSYLSGGDDLICNFKEREIKHGLGVRTGSYPIEEEFTLPYAIKDVLYQCVKPTVTAVSCGVGTIIADGNVKVCALLLQNDEKKTIIKEVKTFPFKAEIEYEDAMPNFYAVAKVTEKSFKTDISVDEDKNQSVVTVRLVLDFTGSAISCDKVNLTLDAFSLTDCVQLKTGEVENVFYGDLFNCDYSDKRSVSLDDKADGVIAVIGERLEVADWSCTDDKLNVSSVFTATAFLVNGEGNLVCKKIELPLECGLNCPIKSEDKEIYAVCNCKNANLTGDELTFDIDVSFTVYPIFKEKYRCVSEAVSTGKKQVEDSAFSVYIAKDGEDLWELSKRLNLKPEDLIATNKELSFPLTGEERIVVYRQKR